jgi:hypothetical protein
MVVNLRGAAHEHEESHRDGRRAIYRRAPEVPEPRRR